MNRRRTAAVALAVSAVAALSACSSTAHPGAAAVVGDQRITVSTLQAHVAAYQAAAGATGAQQAPGASANLLSLLVNAKLVDQALAAQGKSVSTGEVQQTEEAYAQQLGSAQALQQAIITQLHIAPSDFATFARYQVGQQMLIQLSGVDPSSNQAPAAFQKILQKSATSLGVTVNPRYGSWSAKATADSPWPPLTGSKQPWLKAEPAAATS
ncbi:hypothetical protein [Streptacidiphilus sp. PAMC 29251]